MVGLGAVPSGIQCILLMFLPESRKSESRSDPRMSHQKPHLARILVRRGQMDAAHSIMTKIYSYATPEQVSLKVRALHSAVKRSIDIADSTTLLQRLGMAFMNPVNRRAVSKSPSFSWLQ